MFIREQANKIYSPLSYFIAKNMIEMPAIALGPMLTLHPTRSLVHRQLSYTNWWTKSSTVKCL